MYIIPAALMLLTSLCLSSDDQADNKRYLKKYNKLVQGLSEKKWKDRESAEKNLINFGKEDPDTFLKEAVNTYLNTSDPEIKIRIKDVIREVVIYQHFKEESGFLGIAMQKDKTHLSLEGKQYFPVYVGFVIPESGAAKAGFKEGDKILEADGNVCDGDFDTTHLVRLIARKKVGDKINFVVYSNGRKETREPVLGKRAMVPGDMPEEQKQDDLFKSWFKDAVREAEEKNRKESKVILD